MLQPIRELTFRPSAQPGILSPVTVRSTGRYRLGPRPEVNAPRPFTQVFWVREGAVAYRRKGRTFACGGGMVFWYAANEPHHVAAGDPSGEYYWATFDGAWAGAWLAAAQPGPGPRLAGPCPVGLFEEIRTTIRLPSVEAEQRAAELGLRLLLAFVDTASQGTEPEPSRDELICRQIEQLVSEHFRDPDFGIETVAGLMRLHRSTLFRLYRARRGITPSAYLQRQRLQHGLELLRQDAVSITDAALASGYRDANYFAKVIRRATGEPPRRVRRGSSG